MKSKVFVTGASGLLGSHFLIQFSQEYEEVIALYRSEEGRVLVEELFRYYGKLACFAKVKWVRGDVTDLKLLQSIVKNVDLVVHSAALVSFEKEDVQELYQVNVQGTKNVLKAISGSQVEQLVFISSVATIRNKNLKGFFVEDGEVEGGRSWSDYARSKTQSEELVLAARENGLDVLVINPGVILGPGNINNSSTAIFKTVKDGLMFYTSGVNGVIDVRDVVDSVVGLLELKHRSKRYVCVSHNISFKHLFDQIAIAFDVRAPKLKVNALVLSVACRLESVVAKLLKRKPRITKENTAAAFLKMQYDSSLLVQETGIEFRKLSDTIENAVLFFKKLESKP
ncbi:MAG: SDR family NAD(P)-dependent oxidoreductase [Flavobacteriales bacterium]|jgi:nucleoside-diphosphate-sugar epimerase|nr:SDR family NAD(P)-dependent oxidoreductase [Flavobacteriales bacterium]